MDIKKYLPNHWCQLIFVLALFVLTTTNVFALKKDINRIAAFKAVLDHQLIGYQFAGLEQITKGIKYIGYYTDQNLLTNQDASKLFAHAQYILAPSILELNNTSDHSFILFVCSDEKIAWKKIKELKAIPLRRNKFGMILARKTK